MAYALVDWPQRATLHPRKGCIITSSDCSLKFYCMRPIQQFGLIGFIIVAGPRFEEPTSRMELDRSLESALTTNKLYKIYVLIIVKSSL